MPDDDERALERRCRSRRRSRGAAARHVLAQARQAGVVVVAGQVDERREHARSRRRAALRHRAPRRRERRSATSSGRGCKLRPASTRISSAPTPSTIESRAAMTPGPRGFAASAPRCARVRRRRRGDSARASRAPRRHRRRRAGRSRSGCAATNAVWRWYFAREIAIYRAFAASTAAVPRAAPARGRRGLARDRALARRRRSRRRRTPHAELAPATLDALARAARSARRVARRVPDRAAAAARPRAAARAPARGSDRPAWIADGIARAASRGIALEASTRLAAHDPRARVRHGDLLLRNVVWRWPRRLGVRRPPPAPTGTSRCCGRSSPERARVLERALARPRRFCALAAFALVREIRFLHAFRTRPSHAVLVRLRADVAEVLARLP